MRGGSFFRGVINGRVPLPKMPKAGWREKHDSRVKFCGSISAVRMRRIDTDGRSPEVATSEPDPVGKFCEADKLNFAIRSIRNSETI